MGLVYSPDYLSEEVPGTRLPQPPPGPDVGVEVSVTRGKHQVDVLMAHHYLLHSHSQILDTRRCRFSPVLGWCRGGRPLCSARTAGFDQKLPDWQPVKLSDVTFHFRSIYRFDRDIFCINPLLSWRDQKYPPDFSEFLFRLKTQFRCNFPLRAKTRRNLQKICSLFTIVHIFISS